MENKQTNNTNNEKVQILKIIRKYISVMYSWFFLQKKTPQISEKILKNGSPIKFIYSIVCFLYTLPTIWT